MHQFKQFAPRHLLIKIHKCPIVLKETYLWQMKEPLFNPEPFSAAFSAKPDTRVRLFTFGDSTHGAWGQTAGYEHRSQ